ncbi:hypothetical protein PENTCL1PPCAC_10463, partial [Pristionchus entomophagus]
FPPLGMVAPSSSLSSSTISSLFRSSSSSSNSSAHSSASRKSQSGIDLLSPATPTSGRSCRSRRASSIVLRSGRSSSCSTSSYGDEGDDCVESLAASLENNQSQIDELGDYFIGLKTAEEANASTTPTGMRLYYQLPLDGNLTSRLPLFLVYQSSEGQHFHFPIVQEGAEGRWRVKYGESKKLSYPSLISLMRHHLNYMFASPYVPGTFDSFEVWKAYTHI